MNKSVQTADSLKAENEPDWNPTLTRGRFTNILRCDNLSCSDTAVVCGEAATTEFYTDPDNGYSLGDSLTIVVIHPSPLPFFFHSAIPPSIKELTQASSRLLWIDPEGAANKLRLAVELLLTLQKVKLYTIDKHRRRVAIKLHDRIIDYRDNHHKANEANMLFAVKWIGNAGSHIGGLSQSDVLDGFDMLDHVLDEIYVKTRSALLKKVAGVNARKGPSKRK